MRPWSTSGRLLPGLTAQRLSTQGPAVQLLLKTTNVETADNVGIQKLKRFHMVNIKTKFLREYTDQVISFRATTVGTSVHPGPGLKPQAPSFKLQALKDTSGKHQAPSTKVQATSRKQQAPGSGTLQKVSSTFDQGTLPR